MALLPDASQFDFAFDQQQQEQQKQVRKRYSYAAEQALQEQERSLEELEATVKETPPRSSITLSSNGHMRTPSEARSIGDVFDESERLLPPGSPGLRHTKGRLETAAKMASPGHHDGSFADVLKHEQPHPSTPSPKSTHSRLEKNRPVSREGFPRIINNGASSPAAPSPRSIKQEPAGNQVADTSTQPNDTSVAHPDSSTEATKHEPTSDNHENSQESRRLSAIWERKEKADYDQPGVGISQTGQPQLDGHGAEPGLDDAISSNTITNILNNGDASTNHTGLPQEQNTEQSRPARNESQSAAEQAAKQSTFEGQTTKRSLFEEQTTQTTKHSTSEDQTTQQSASEDQTTKQSTSEDQTTKQPTFEGQTTKQSALEEQTTQTTKQSTIEDQVIKQPAFEDQTTKQPTPVDQTTEQTHAEKRSSQAQLGTEPQAEQTTEQQQASHTEPVTNGESYAEVVKHEPTSPSLEHKNQLGAEHAQAKPAEDFADSATVVSEEGTTQSFVGTGTGSSLHSPHRRAHKKASSRSLNGSASKALQQALQETDTLPKLEPEDLATADQQPEKPEGTGSLVYENFHSRSGTSLASVQLPREFELPKEQKENKQISTTTTQTPEAKDKARDNKLVSGRMAGAGWAKSAIRWAPLNTPLQRRLQTLAVLAHSLSIAGLLALFFALCTVPIFWPVLMPYLIYVLLSRAPTNGKLAHRSEWIRRSKFWSLFASYFPARLHRTVELESTRKYIFGYHPHGIISHGAFAAFTTEALGFSQLFPGITNTLLTLDSNFRVPLYRDWALRLGLASVSRESCENILSHGGPNGEGMGRAITIVIGGARESLDAKPGMLNLVLAKRKGFVKLAVRAGADLVPVLAFGENDLYDQIDSTTHPWVHKGQLLVKKLMGFTVPLFHARGIFNYDVGIMPYRRPINIVVGRPIRTVQNAKPDPAYVDKLHKQYTDELLHIWEEWKDVFSPQRTCELNIIE